MGSGWMAKPFIWLCHNLQIVPECSLFFPSQNSFSLLSKSICLYTTDHPIILTSSLPWRARPTTTLGCNQIITSIWEPVNSLYSHH
jgi:hypothetical protein